MISPRSRLTLNGDRPVVAVAAVVAVGGGGGELAPAHAGIRSRRDARIFLHIASGHHAAATAPGTPDGPGVLKCLQNLGDHPNQTRQTGPGKVGE